MRSARSASLATALILAMASSGCLGHLRATLPARVAPSATHQPLPPIPADLRACFAGVTDLPPQASWDGALAGEVAAKLRKSELAKTDCGRRLIAFYEDVSRGLAK